jgi:hypothetical protein
MALYGGIDLHANNSVIALLDAHDQVVTEKRLPNDLNTILAYLAPYHAELVGLSTTTKVLTNDGILVV